jgi:hypothetical protein
MIRDPLGRILKPGQKVILAKHILPEMILAQVMEVNDNILTTGPNQQQPRTVVFALGNFTVGLSGPGDVVNVSIIVQEADESIPQIDGKTLLTN